VKDEVARTAAVGGADLEGDAYGSGEVAATVDRDAPPGAGEATLDGEPDASNWIAASRVEMNRDAPPAETRVEW